MKEFKAHEQDLTARCHHEGIHWLTSTKTTGMKEFNRLSLKNFWTSQAQT